MEFKGVGDGDLEAVLHPEEDAEDPGGGGEEGATDFDAGAVVADGDDGEGVQGDVAAGFVAACFLVFEDEVAGGGGEVGSGGGAAAAFSFVEVHGCGLGGHGRGGLLRAVIVVCLCVRGKGMRINQCLRSLK